MNTDAESCKPRKKEGQYNKRPHYYRNYQGRGGSNRQKYQDSENVGYSSTQLQEDSSYNNNLEYSGATNINNFSAVNSSKPNNFRSFNRSKYSDYKNLSKENRSNKSFYHSSYRADDICPESSSNSNVPNPPQRGQIVGGRYIRKQSNQPQVTSTRTYHDLQTEKVDGEKNISKHQSSYKYGNSSHYNSESQELLKTNESCSDRETDSYSSQSATASSNPSYQSREFNRKLNSTYCHSVHLHKYEDQNSVVKEPYYKKTYKQRSSSPRTCDDDKATQRELLISRLNKGECECLVCCEHIRTKDQIWHCLSCYHVFHLRCIRKWARSPAAAIEDGSWRCPACQSLNSKVPFNYYCFCGKNKNPEVNYHLTPHSCGEICDRSRTECSHHCKELCHPGPCPPCVIVVQKSCPCGKTNQTLPCNQSMETSCQYECGKLLNCREHRCKSRCHDGECQPCEEIVVQKCYCGKNEQYVACTKDTASCFVYSCGIPCNKTLHCGHHTCASICHPGDCQPCQMSSEIVKSCCCGKTNITDLVSAGKAQKRTSCQDPLPLCGMKCEKKLFCGPKENPHTCQSLCHEGQCPPCTLATSMKCICGAFTKEFPCAEITQSFVYKCEKRCNRRKDCGRHKCLNNCCTNIEHKCELVCNKKLSCGLHHCQETCHMGNCPTCWNVSFDELRCHCGVSVLYPPIHCGTKPPECSQPCIRNHPCDHDVKHTCHSDEHCPPCTSLTTKWCYGKHKQCGPVMCFLDGISCGMPCQKPLPCGRHKCKLTCHVGECLKESEKCTQPCSTPRLTCGHPCGIPCHDGPCPETPCKAQVTSNCPCGRRSETTSCFDSSKSYRLLSSTILATKMQEIKEGQSVNLNDVLGKKSKNNKLQCNEECAVIERNKRLAVALQIQNPDLSCSPGPPSYSEFLKDEAKKSPQFVADVYDKLANLVQLAKQSKQKCRSHSFPPMNRDQRRIVHELAEFFGCETQSYDEEPKRNVVATAYKSRCWLPFINIMAVVQRDKGIRKGPAPVLTQRDTKSAPGPNASSSVSSQKKKIDYFDYNE